MNKQTVIDPQHIILDNYAKIWVDLRHNVEQMKPVHKNVHSVWSVCIKVKSKINKARSQARQLL